MTTHSPMLPSTIRHAAWILTRYNVRRDTNDPVREDSRTEIQERDASIGKTSSRSQSRSKNVNQLLQPWVTNLWLRRDTLSDEHVTGTAAGVMRSRPVRRLQDPARWVPAALNAMLLTPTTLESSSAALDCRDQHTNSPLNLERSLRFPQQQPRRIQSQKQQRRRRMMPASQRREDVKR